LLLGPRHKPVGIGPDKLLELRSKDSKLACCEKESGKPPVKALYAKSSLFRLVIFNKVSTGNSPVKLLVEISRVSNEVQEPRLLGTEPFSLFKERSSITRPGQASTRCKGISPSKRFPPSERDCKLAVGSTGIEPENLLLETFKKLSLTQAPIA
jgi:hypothetical protein